MDLAKQHLAELFGLVKLDDDASDGPKKVKKGRTAAESAELGRQAQERGDTMAAIEHFELAREQADGKSARALIDLAAAYEWAGREEDSQKLFAEAALQFGDEAEPRVGLSETMKRNSRFREALEELERAIATEPNNPLYHFKRAEACRDMKLFSDAVHSAERAALCAPDNAFFHFWLGDLLIEFGRFSDALEPLRVALELSPGEDYYLARASVAFWGAGKAAEALRAVRMAGELAPDNSLYPLLQNFYLRVNGEPEVEIDGDPNPYDLDTVARIAKQLGLDS